MSDLSDSRAENGTGDVRAQLELRHLRYFLAVADHLSFRQAAAVLDIAQPALSQQIQVLERIVGARLFERTSRSVQLTQAGALFRREAEQTLQQSERARLVAERAGRGELGRIVIAYAGSTLFTGILSAHVQAFHRQFPLVHIEVEEIGIEEQLDHLQRGSIDVGFLRLPIVDRPDPVNLQPIHSEPIVLAVPSEHRLAGFDSVDVSELASERLISSQSDRVGILRQVMDAAISAGFTPTVHRTHHFGAIIGLVSAGLGVAAVPASAQVMQLPGVVYRNLTGVGPTCVAVASRAFEVAPPVVAFMDIVRGQDSTDRRPPRRPSQTKAGTV